MKYNETDFLKAIASSFQKYKEHGSRSPEKLKPIQAYVALLLQSIWGSGFGIHYIGEGSKEMTVEGKYYPKDIDIAISDKGKPVFCLGIKFVTSNYKQNANNYFESMMGETANIQALSDVPYAQLLILRHQTPYYPKNETEKAKKIEVINEKDLSKYLRLVFDTVQAHRPQMLGILLVDIEEASYGVASTDLDHAFRKDFADLLRNKVSLRQFFHEIENYRQFYILPD